MPAATGALSNDFDVDGDTITAISATQGAHGSLVGGPDGSFTYKPTAGYSGVDTFTYTISDGKGGTATGTVTVTVGAVNQPPVAPGGSATTNEDTPLSGTLPASDPDSTALTYAITQQPTKGTISLNAATGAYTYTPSANANGTDTFKYTVSDGTTTTHPRRSPSPSPRSTTHRWPTAAASPPTRTPRFPARCLPPTSTAAH